jgi:hypothetical protein
MSFIGSAGAMASTQVDTRIHDLITPVQAGDSVRVMSTVDGRVYEVDSAQKGLVATLIKAKAKNAPLSLMLDAHERIVKAVELPAKEAAAYADVLTQAESEAVAPSAAEQNSFDQDFVTGDSDDSSWIGDNKGLGYRATNVSSMSKANTMFAALLDINFKGSECYQRAHMWTKYMLDYHSVYSMKNFLFFTNSFVREHKYRWWFHVAPMIYVQGKEVMMDAEFGLTHPYAVQDWTDHFMMDPNFVHNGTPFHPVCTEVKKYSDFENHQSSQDCYTLKLPMYYYQPADAENLETDGTRINYFRDWDVKHSKKCFKRFWKC